MPSARVKSKTKTKSKNCTEEAKQAAEARRADTANLKAQWLDQYVSVGWRKACEVVGCAISLPSYWKRSDEEFNEKYQQAAAYQPERMEALLDAVIDGTAEDMSPTRATLLKFRLQAMKPERYRDRVSIEQSGPGGGPIKIESGEAARGLELLDRWRASD